MRATRLRSRVQSRPSARGVTARQSPESCGNITILEPDTGGNGGNGGGNGGDGGTDPSPPQQAGLPIPLLLILLAAGGLALSTMG